MNFLDRFFKNPKISVLKKIRPVEKELFHGHGLADVHKDVMELIVAFLNSAKKRLKITAGFMVQVERVCWVQTF